jgi:TRAP-type C4-dicarboxylate transport system substrate-binding protein
VGTLVPIFLLISAFNASAAEFNLKFQTYLPPALSGANKRMAEDIEKMSGGRIKVTLFTSAELVSSSDTLKACRSGIIDIAMGSGYHFSELKSGTIQAGMPMTWSSPVEAEVLWEKMGFKALVAQSFEPFGVHYLGPVLLSPYAITSKKPVRNLQDLSKMKIRATSGPAKMFKKLGINTTYLKSEEMYLALTTGQIDGVLWGGAADYDSMNFPEVSPWYCNTYIVNPIVDSLFISNKTWKKLPDDLKAIIENAAHRSSWEYMAGSMYGEYKIQNDKYKGKITTLPEEDVIKLTDAAQIIWDEEAQKDPLNQKMVDKIKELLRSLGRLK